MSRPRIYADAAERQRAFHARRRNELRALREKAQRHPRHDEDVYLTPPAFVRAGLERVTVDPVRILDPGAGAGVWGEWAKVQWPDAHLIGVELRDLVRPAAYDEWITGDFLAVAATLPPVDLVLGNPPYRHAEPMIRAGLSLLRPGGDLLFFLRLAFREGQQRARGLFREYPLAELAVADRRPVFYGNKGGMTAFAYYRWQQGYRGETRCTNAFIGDRDEGGSPEQAGAGEPASGR